ncbi:hypothetical protein NA57DRAFT_58934 [Rhizodiscina lignyota]|uniref:Nuclear pore complex component n=1 Tax=Rhizodiscina lignyota TaxID=1504668 RepID=A0A9P4IAU5_9PEZI|nr:hypothetical protein NA57DRAFT_58934 [Rhizodiscina lignyota]
MSLTATPKTPSTQTPISFTASTSNTPGTWRHPRLDEITRRQHAATFTTNNLRIIFFNAALLFCTFLRVPSFLTPLSSLLSSTLASIPPESISYAVYLLNGLRLLCLTNIVLALAPLYSKPDEMSDIPLTPSQRKLLGLNPTPSSSAPPTPRDGYITPPRYSRSPSASLHNTPQSGNSRRAVAGSSPGSASRPGFVPSPRASPFASGSPTQREREGSPFLYKAVTGSGGRESGGLGRRSSYGSSHSPLGLGRSGSDSLLGMGLGEGSVFGASSMIPSTPTPAGSAGKPGGPSVTLTNKWLYKNGRSSLGGRGFY